MNNIDIFCDGSCLDNGKPLARAGWAYVVVDPKSKEVMVESFGKIRAGVQTNNRSELEAMLQSLVYIKEEGKEETFYTIHCDSEIAVLGITGESARNANKDIWVQIEKLCVELHGRFTVVSMKNDKNNNEDYIYIMNNLADRLAKQGANSLLLQPITY